MPIMWKCTGCKLMVPQHALKQHVCSPVANTKSVELAYLRGKQEAEGLHTQPPARRRRKKATEC
jgi:hypothetical protein